MQNNNTILVLGAGGLLGHQLVKQLLENQYHIIAADINTEAMKSRLMSAGLDLKSTYLTLVQLDITNDLAVKSFFDQQTSLQGIVNCSYPRNSQYGTQFLEVNLTSFNENMSLHLGSAFLIMQQSALLFKRQQSPLSLVNISSIYGVVAPKFSIYENTSMTMPVEYAAIKSAILHLSKYTVAFVKDSQFRINSVSPGGLFDHQDSHFLDKYKKQTMGKGMLDVSDIMESILFLLSEKSAYITGQNIIIDDGFTL